jgi:hypothetical protein
MGTAFTSGGSTVQPFAGLGTNLYDDRTTTYLNASNFNGLYFEYRTVGADQIRVELHDGASVAANNGADFYVNLPGTGGAWMAATVPFSQFTLPGWASTRNLGVTNLAKIQILNNRPLLAGATACSILVDNVRFLGANSFIVTTPPTPTATLSYSAGANGAISRDGGVTMTLTHSAEVEVGTLGPSVLAVPNSGFEFVNWSDGLVTALRQDLAAAGGLSVNATFRAVDEPPPPVNRIFHYTAGANGTLTAADVPGRIEFFQNIAQGQSGVPVTAVPNAGYVFVRWDGDDNAATNALPARTDVAGASDRAFTAIFASNGGVVVPPEQFTITYRAGEGGGLTVSQNGMPIVLDSAHRFEFRAVPGSVSPYTVTAVPNAGYEFVNWSGGAASAVPSRSGDVVGAANTEFVATFVEEDTDPIVTRYTLTYIAGIGGNVMISGVPSGSFTRRVDEGVTGPTVTAVPNAGFTFLGWDDGLTDLARADVATEDLSFTALFQTVSVLSSDREVPGGGSVVEMVVVAPVTILAGEITAAPNPAARQAGGVNFFRTGGELASGKLVVYNAAGSVVRRISVADANDCGCAGRRVVAGWDLTDTKGRPVADGTYLVRGVVKTRDGRTERVSILIGVR